MVIVPEVSLNTGYQMPLVGFGTATYPFAESETVKQAILCGIKNGYRHFDTASLYQTEQVLGEAVAEALRIGLIKSRDELFITSKLWCSDCHQDRVLPALKKTLQNLQLDYLDLYLVHWPMSSIPGKYDIPKPEELRPMEFQSVWEKMEESQMLGLTKSIGVSNFSIKKIEQLLVNAKVIPAVVQVEMNPMWQQRKLIEFCKTTDIVVTGYSPLGGADGIMNNELLREIVVAKGKTLSQVCLRWLYEQGVTFVVKSFNEERMKENLRIFDWELSEEERKQISQLPQRKRATGEEFVSAQAGPFKSINELWDGEI